MTKEQIITIDLKDGRNVPCYVVGTFSVDDKEYLSVAPDDGTDDIYIYRLEVKPKGMFDLFEIEDTNELASAMERFNELIS